MAPENGLIEKLTKLNYIAETLNRAVDVRGVLDDALAHLVKLMGLETGWIFVKDPTAQERWWGPGFVLAAHHNLPPALALDNAQAWERGCDCQEMCNEACLNQAHNEIRCGRLASVPGDRRGLAVHASAPLSSGDRILGILNVAGPDWASFSPEALALLTNVGTQIGVALERARLFDLTQERRIGEQAALLDFSNQLLSRLDLDELLDYLVKRVGRVLQADACALLLPDTEPGVLDFRAASGWRVDPVAQGYRVPADEQSGPGLAMGTQQPFQVQDFEEHNPTDWRPDWLPVEGFRGHAVVPLITEGRSVGSLMIDSRQPRLLDENEIRLLRLMANQAAIALEKVRLHHEEVKGHGLERELEVGQQIQLSLLPKAPPVVPGWEFSTFYQPARLVGGDFYDFFELPGEPRRLGIVIADVAGKGVPAALYMALCRTVIRTVALNGYSPVDVLTRANKLILNDSRSELFLTAFYATLDTHSGRLIYARAGHNPPLWWQAATGQVQALDVPGIVIGAFSEIELEERQIDMAPGDSLLFYTDGVTEAMDDHRREFGDERLRAIAAAQTNASAEELVETVVSAARAHSGDAPQSDDMTLIGVRRCPVDT